MHIKNKRSKSPFSKLLIAGLSLVFALVSCTDEKEEVIEKLYPNGSPEVVAYFKGKKEKRQKVKEIQYYFDGTKRSKGRFSGNRKDGTWLEWHDNGNLHKEESFKNGVVDGKITVYYPDGKKRYVGYFANGQLTGKWTYWDIHGEFLYEQDYGMPQ